MFLLYREMGVNRLWMLAFLLVTLPGYAQDNLLKKEISLKVSDQPLQEVLMVISDQGKFNFSYDATIFSDNQKISLTSDNEPVKAILDRMLPENIEYKVSGNHLILLKKPVSDSGKKEKYLITGRVADVRDQQPLNSIVVYEVSSLVSDVTDADGKFSMAVPAHYEQLGLSFSHKAVADTVILIMPQDQQLIISLTSFKPAFPAKSIKTMPVADPVESFPLVQKLVSPQSLLRTEHSDIVLRRTAQISFLPTLGSNLKMSGLIKNQFSVNVLAGYARGAGLVELGGLFNIIRNNVNGFQAAGLGNVTGGKTSGFQLAGIFNHNKGSLVGFQAAGIHNMLIDSLHGVQLAGISNILKGDMKGAQISGINNLTTRNADGFQLAGLTNLALGDVRTIQLAGLFNKGRNVKGIQFAGLANLAAGEVRGFQLAGLINLAGKVNAIQFAGIGNIATDTVSGIQISSIFNYARYTKSSQIALLNVADTASGTPIGLLSFVRKGFRSVEFASDELQPLNLTLKTGVRRFYNIFTGGYGNWGGSTVWSFGYGFGSEKLLAGSRFVSVEYTAHWVSERNRLQEQLSLLNRLNINFGWNTLHGLGLSAGPAINVWLSEWHNPETEQYLTDLAPYTLLKEKIGTTLLQVWIGGKVAVRL